MPDTFLTWLGHATFRLDTPGGKRIYIDPFLSGNPRCPAGEREPERVDVIAITHGHGDHVGDAVDLAQRFTPEIVANVELKAWLGRQGAPVGDLPGINKGGSQEVDGIRFTLTNAFHSSGSDDGAYLGEAGGLVVRLENGTVVYHAGDTCVFGDMSLIGRIYQPDVALLPIGGWFTMDPAEAAVALELLEVRRCVPMHYGTFPVLTGSPDELRAKAPGVEVLTPEPGEPIEL